MRGAMIGGAGYMAGKNRARGQAQEAEGTLERAVRLEPRPRAAPTSSPS